MGFELTGFTRRNALIAGIGLTSAFAVMGCQFLGLRWVYRYRLTVEIEADGELTTGSSVIEVIRTSGPTGIDGESHGEAVAIDLRGGTLFALLRGDMAGLDWPFSMPHWAFAAMLGGTDMVDSASLDRLVNLREVTATLQPAQYPWFVTFRDLRDPKSVERVDPGNIAGTYGPGITLKRVTVQISQDSVTNGIRKRLIWLDQYYDRMLDGSRLNDSQSLANNLTQSDFIS